MSAGVESTTKSGRVRRVPLADQAAAALDRLSQREHFTAPGELVFCSVLGRPFDGSALRRRYRRAQLASEVRPLWFHDLRHTFGSLLAAGGVDVVTIQRRWGTARSGRRVGIYTRNQPLSRLKRPRMHSRREKAIATPSRIEGT
jgi:integrase